MKDFLSRRLIRALCPYAEEAVIRRLWRAGYRRKLFNYLWVEFLIARGSTRLWGGKPYWLTVDPTNFCQLSCPFCPTGANRGVRGKSAMTLEHFKLIMDRLGPAVVHMDLINWGESLLHKQLPDMIACAKSHGIEVKLDANLNDMPEGTAERLVLSGLDILSVSLDGLTQETYQKYRVGGNLEKALSNLGEIVDKRRELGRSTPWIIWQFLVFRHNEHEAAQVEAFARSRGADQVGVTPASLPNEPGYLWEWLPRDPARQIYPLPAEAPPLEAVERARGNAHVKKTPSSLALHVRRYQPRQLLAWRPVLRSLARVRGPGDVLFLLKRYRELLRELSVRRAGNGVVPFKDGGDGPRLCKWPWAGMAINPNGSVSPCCSIESEADDLGNVFTQRWSALWNGAAYRAARRHVRRYIRGREGIRPGSDHVCERCSIIGYANFKFPDPRG